MSRMIHPAALCIFMPEQEEQNHKTGPICFYECITDFVSVIICTPILLIINRVKKQESNPSLFLFVVKILTAILKVSMECIALSEFLLSMQINGDIHHSRVLW